MKTLMVANNDGKMPKGFIKQLKSVSKSNWQYDNQAKCFFAEIDDEAEAKLTSMKIIAISTGVNTHYYCAYMDMEDRDTIFYFNRLEGYIPMKKENNSSITD